MTQQLLQIGLYIMGAIGTIVTAASAAAKFIDPLSPLGQWVAWVASCPIGHSPRVIAPVLLPTTAAAKKAKAISDAMADSGRALVLLVALGSLPLLNGCAGTFEEARLARPQALMVAKTPANRCSTLSDREYWFDVASYGMGAAGVGTVLAAIPASEKHDSALVISGAAAGAISVVSGFASQHAGAAYVREGCGR